MALKDYWTMNGHQYEGMQPGHTMGEGPAFSNAVAVVKIDNLEEACERIRELNQTALLGFDVTRKLYTIIEGLKEAWRGSDAVVHINNMMVWKSFSGAFSSTALEITEAMHREMMRMNQKQVANGGKEVYTGSIVSEPIGDFMKDSDDLVDTGEVYVDTAMARTQLQNLRDVQESFSEFCERYSKVHDFVLEVWQSGGARDFIEEVYSEFSSQFDLMRSEFSEAIQALDQAIQNWEA